MKHVFRWASAPLNIIEKWEHIEKRNENEKANQVTWFDPNASDTDERRLETFAKEFYATIGFLFFVVFIKHRLTI